MDPRCVESSIVVMEDVRLGTPLMARSRLLQLLGIAIGMVAK